MAPISPVSPASYEEDLSRVDVESGYASGDSEQSLPEVYFSKPHLRYINQQLSRLEPEQILRWCLVTLPGLYQTTAFGLTGLVTLDMLSKILAESPASKRSVDLIFLDTLFHFDETLALVDRVRQRYPHTQLHVYKPAGAANAADFAAVYGEKLWESNDEHYDWVAKVEPAERAYRELNVKAALTGRRRSQGGKRGDLDIIEVNDDGMIKVNPLANWSFAEVQAYVKKHDVPYNELLDRGYKSVGDWHSTSPVAAGEDERSGRWKGQAKTECGIHNKKSRYAQFLREQQVQAEEEEAALAVALDGVKLEA